MPPTNKHAAKAVADNNTPQFTDPLGTIARQVAKEVASHLKGTAPTQPKNRRSPRVSAGEEAGHPEDQLAELVSKTLARSLASRSVAAKALRMALIAQLANTEPGATAPVAPLPAEAGAEDMLTTFEAAARLNISRPTVSMLCNQGKLGGVIKTEGGHRRIPASAIEAYKASRLARS